MAKFFLFFLMVSPLMGSELKSITQLLKKTHEECGKFELLSDRLLCYRRVKKEHRGILDTYFKKLQSEQQFSDQEIKDLKKEIYSKLESVY